MISDNYLLSKKQTRAINRFGPLPNVFAEGRSLVLCCRLEEYHQLRENAGHKLLLSNAAILQEIAPAWLEGHLRRQELDALWNQIEHSENLLRLAQRPLFLGLMIAVADELRQGSRIRQGETWEDCIWRLYLNDCLAPTRPDHGRKCNKEQSLHWLRCLAKWMQAEQKVELQIDELQPTMLKRYWTSGLLYLLIYILFFGITGWLFKGPIRDVKIGVLLGVEMGLFFWLYFMKKILNAKLGRYLLIVIPLSCLGGLVYTLVKTQKNDCY